MFNSIKNHPLSQDIAKERHLLFMQEVGSRMVASVVISLLVGFLFISSHPLAGIVSWFGFIALASIISFVLLRNHRKQLVSPNNISIALWHRRNIFLALLWGAVWSCTPFLFFDDANIVQIMFLLVVVTIISSMPSVSMGCYPDVYISFITPVFAAFTIKLATLNYADVWAHKVMAPTIWLSLVFFSRAIYQTQIQAIILRLEYQQANQRALEANRSKTRFLAAASHDLRQPIQAATFYSDNLSLQQPDNPLLPKLKKTLNETNAMLNKLLDLSQLEAGVIKPNTLDFNLATLVEQLKDVFVAQAKKKAITLKTDCHQAIIHSDPVLLKQVIHNLLSNAISHSDHGQVTIYTEVLENKLLLHIEDNGPGIASELQQEVFKEFVQLPKRDGSKKQGVGLGLNIVDKLCRLLDIPLSLQSHKGQGCRFTIELALKEILLADITAPRPAQQMPFEQQTILIVDDDISVLEALAELLAQWNLDVWPAQSLSGAKQALEQIEHLDLVITDDWLEHGNHAFSVIELAKPKLTKKQSAIIITGNTEPDRLRSLIHSDYVILHKPVNAQQLYENIAKALS